MSSKPDDLEAVRSLADTLQPFASEDRERIIRWAREKLGMTASVAPAVPPRIEVGGGPAQGYDSRRKSERRRHQEVRDRQGP